MRYNTYNNCKSILNIRMHLREWRVRYCRCNGVAFIFPYDFCMYLRLDLREVPGLCRIGLAIFQNRGS